MVKYLSFHNSSFALRYFFMYINGKAHSVTHPLLYTYNSMILKGIKWPKFDAPLQLQIQYIVSYTETDEILLLLSSFPVPESHS
jgi:hypothetical protein